MDFGKVLFGEVFVSRYDSLYNNRSVLILFRNNGLCKFFKLSIGFGAFVVEKFQVSVIALAGAEGLFEPLNIITVEFLALHGPEGSQFAFWNFGGGFEFAFFIHRPQR